MQINLTGFLNGKYARVFMGELWGMLDSAQSSDSGIPTELLNAKMDELKDRKSEDVKLKESLRKLADSMGAEAQRQENQEDARFNNSRRRSRSRDRYRMHSGPNQGFLSNGYIIKYFLKFLKNILWCKKIF